MWFLKLSRLVTDTDRLSWGLTPGLGTELALLTGQAWHWFCRGNEYFRSGTQKGELMHPGPMGAFRWRGSPGWLSCCPGELPGYLSGLCCSSLCQSFLGSRWAHLMRRPASENTPSPLSSLGECQRPSVQLPRQPETRAINHWAARALFL